ncbi:MULTISPECIES: ABC transporter ATP-binding protein [unclassified Rhizobium]|uniref:ABC transporter ATP-binding protein n=1 Tax=unclassified Rhizobium TaxID=2613769 RepID=UPI00040F1E3A|nr:MULTISPECIES: ABC transporter ATP-binding protein [unclassified Rhizobium]MBD9454973.1 ABC transporter ATP-binding protein [Rhizobium sp. RHZ02]NMN71536.1 multiple sugar transport system ATP-binding protein [Rhizobium sp. 57MFTsu3.2]
MAEIQIDSLIKQFGAFRAVTDVNIKVKDGEFVFLLGPSGCGKTTTLRMIAGLEMPSSGRIAIGERNVTFLRPRHRNVGMVFQDYGLYRHLTVFGNIAYPLEVRRFGRKEIDAKVKAVAHTMQITDVLQRKPDQLSAGQLQRVAIARMLVRDADVFLMDEPMSHLDAQLRGQMRAELRHIQKSVGVTTIFVTHDQLEAMTMADRIIVMKNGEMLQFATPREIFERPATEFVATFVGEPQMNVFDVTLVNENGSIIAKTRDFNIPLQQDWVRRWGLEKRLDSPLRLGVRPENISVSEKADAACAIPAELFSFEPTGAENLYVLQCGDVTITTRSSTTETAGLSKQDGSRLYAGFDPNWIYLFEPGSGRTIAQALASRPDTTEN